MKAGQRLIIQKLRTRFLPTIGVFADRRDADGDVMLRQVIVPQALELVERLESNDPDDRKAAESVLLEASKLLEMNPDSLRDTLTLIKRAPFTRFLVDLSYKRFPRRSRPSRKAYDECFRLPTELAGAPRPLPRPVEPSSQPDASADRTSLS